jgi:hypothetical protein
MGCMTGSRGIVNLPLARGDVERNRTHGKQRVDGEKKGRTLRTKEGRWMDDTWQQEKGGKEDDVAGEGPTLAKYRAAEKDGAV